MARYMNIIRRQRIRLICAGCLMIFNEYLSYYIQAFRWRTLSCPDGSECTRLLFVADPQILGEQDETLIARWDNDRYLRRTFAQALTHTAPDGIIFLGDLMDEGSRASDCEFQRYTDRFLSIFPTHEHMKTLYIPGDNDVGGEGGEPILPNVVFRFRRAFNKTAEVLVGPCRILKVNPILEAMPHVDGATGASDKHVRIAVSHFPLLGLTSPFTDQVVQQFQPHLIFSAHTHMSRLRRGLMASLDPLESLQPLSIDRGVVNMAATMSMNGEGEPGDASDINEIVVPTCSYRMGVYSMGYGYALIDSTRRELWYEVLWLPSRFEQILLHVVVITATLLIISCQERLLRFKRQPDLVLPIKNCP